MYRIEFEDSVWDLSCQKQVNKRWSSFIRLLFLDAQRPAVKDPLKIKSTVLMSTVCAGVRDVVISSYMTVSLLVNCCHCFQPSDSVLLCWSPGLSVPVELCLCTITWPFSAVSVSFFIPLLFYPSQRLFLSMFLPPSLPLTLICLSSGLFTLPLPHYTPTVQHSSPIWSE